MAGSFSTLQYYKNGDDASIEAPNPYVYEPRKKESTATPNDVISAISDQPDKVKYNAAVQIAKNNLVDERNVDDNRLRQEIDQIYEQLNPSTTGADQRGEGVFNIVHDLKNLIDSGTLAVGNALDAVNDTVIGNIVGAAGHIFGNDTIGEDYKNAFNGKDLQGFADIAADIALAGAGPVGWGAVIAKNAIQQSENMQKALTGVNNITGEKLDEDERNGALSEAILGTALSAIPVAGKVVAPARYLSKVNKVAKQNVTNKMGDNVSDILDFGKNVAKERKVLLDDLFEDAVKTDADSLLKSIKSGNMKDYANNTKLGSYIKDRKALNEKMEFATRKEKKALKDEFKDMRDARNTIQKKKTLEGKSDYLANAETNLQRRKQLYKQGSSVEDKMLESLEKANKKIKKHPKRFNTDKKKEAFRDLAMTKAVANNLGQNTAVRVASRIASPVIGGAAGFAGNVDNMLDMNYINGVEGNPSNMITAVLPSFLASIASKGKTGLTGTKGALSMLNNFALGANTSMKQVDRNAEGYINPGMSNDDIIRELEVIKSKG